MQRPDLLGGQVSFAADGPQYLTFLLGGEEYGIEILKVQEIRGYSPITPLPNTPGYVKGIMNLRGTIIPVVDLRSRLSMRAMEPGPFTVIIVVKVGTKVKGMIVDAVSDVVSIPATEIQAPPDFGSQPEARFVKGLAGAGEKLLVLLDLDQALVGDDAAPSGAVA
jgi:purine-binding chemotaxis protein CheW